MSAETVDGLTVTVTITGSVRGSGNDAARLPVNINYSKTFTDGTGTNQCQAFWWDDARALNNTNETLDLDGNTDFKGTAMSDVVGVKLMYFENNSTTSGDDLTIGGGDFSAMFADPTDKIKIGPAGCMLLVSPIDGYTVTASTGDGLLVATDYNGTYDIFLALDNS